MQPGIFHNNYRFQHYIPQQHQHKVMTCTTYHPGGFTSVERWVEITEITLTPNPNETQTYAKLQSYIEMQGKVEL